MLNKPKRIPLQVKLLESNYNKIKTESEKLWITMSALLSLLIVNYKSVNIKSDNQINHE